MSNEEIQTQSYKIESTADENQFSAREQLNTLFEQAPFSIDDKMFNLGLFVRSSLLVKFLVMSDLYQRIVHIPGKIMEFGTWWGQNLVLFENLRAIHEPFNKQRVIVGFDTFSGYTKPSDIDLKSDVWVEHSYSTGSEYKDYLHSILNTHEQCNVLGHINDTHELIEGDVTKTAPLYFKDKPETIVALAYFDMGLYKPTKAAMEALKPNLVKGSVILLDELTWAESPGEAIAFKEVFNDMDIKLEVCKLYPSKTIATVL